MRTYFNPEMNIASFDTEAVEATVNASAALANWQTQQGAAGYNAEVDFKKMTAVNVEF